MTARATLLGLLGAAFICAITFFNDCVLRQTFLVGSYLPIPVFGGLVLFLITVNPLLARLGPRAPLSKTEIAVAITLVFAVCWIPGRGMMHHFSNALMLPHHYARINPAWQNSHVIELIPPRMLADVRTDSGMPLDAFLQGLGEGSAHASVSAIPWRAWRNTIGFWFPLILSLTVALAGLALVVHRQWSSYEQLPYPIAVFVESLLPERGRGHGAIFRHPLFLLGTVAIFCAHMNNYAYAWWPLHVVPFRRWLDFHIILPSLGPLQAAGGESHKLFIPSIFFTVIGLSFFIARDVSLSLGVAPWLYYTFTGICAGYGVQVISSRFAFQNIERNLHAGGYFGLLLVILYTGRHHYGRVLRRGLALPGAPRDVETSAVWGFRAFLAGSVLFVAQLVAVGAEWPYAIAYTAVLVSVSLVVSRVVAETGAFFIHPMFYPGAVLLGLLGPRTLGPETTIILFFVTVILAVDPREIFMPFLIHGLRLVDRTGGRTGRVSAAGVFSAALGLVVAFSVSLYWQYDRGTMSVSDNWTNSLMCPPVDAVVEMIDTLDAQNELERIQTTGALARLAFIAPHPPGLAAFVTACALVLLFFFCRTRFPRWPLHPVLFLTLGTWQSVCLSFSFLIGWFVKSVVMRYGGAGVYNHLKPMMLGLIAGEVLAGCLAIIIGLAYYFVTGLPPRGFSILGG